MIIGGGFAGAATAYHLSARFEGKTILVEKEEIPGTHASGKNASLVLQSIENPEVRKILAASRKAFTQHHQEVGFEELGSLQLGAPGDLEKLQDPDLIESHILEPSEARKKTPLLQDHEFEAALWTPSDGVMDISRLLYFYLDKARSCGNFEVCLNCEVTGIRRRDGRYLIETSLGPIECNLIVNAAGAWAPSIAEIAGIESLQMNSFKRHLFILEGIPVIDLKSPFVWNIAENFYFRPESGGVLFSVCDEELAESEFNPTVNSSIELQLAELIDAQLPAMENALKRQVWSCFRTKTPHGGFYIEWSKNHPSLLWVAGLGGHGMGTSWEVGRLAADKILSRKQS